MAAAMSTQERQLCQFLKSLNTDHGNRYNDNVAKQLLGSLFWCMASGKEEYMNLFFPTGGPLRGGTLKLREAQGAVNGAEYTEAARGHACGHIFRPGEATYSCKTCGTDDTCCLCSRCFESTDHRGHMVRISVSPGNSGCCDCGDPEAWKTPMFCTIHSDFPEGHTHGDGSGNGASSSKGKDKAPAGTPPELEASVRMTIGRALDFMCDVISCSPEQLRQTKTLESIKQDERMSRLSSTYGDGDASDGVPADEFAVLLWNDEKHTVTDVMHQVARACETTLPNGLARAYETDEIGRSLLMHSTSIDKLLNAARILEDIKVTVTIRSSRDTFREQMCGTIIEWLGDISGCSVGNDHDILRRVVCEELLRPWKKGSPATHAIVGANGIDDEELITQDPTTNPVFAHEIGLLRMRRAAQQAALRAENGDDMDDIDDDDDNDMDGFIDALDDEDDDEEEEEDDDYDDGDLLPATLANPITRAALTPGLISMLTSEGDDNDDMMMIDVQVTEAPADAVGQGEGTQTGEGEAASNEASEAQSATTSNEPTATTGHTDSEMVIEDQLEEGEAAMSGTAPLAPPPPPPPPVPPHASAPTTSQSRTTSSRSRRGSAPLNAADTTSSASRSSAAATTGSSRRNPRERDVTPSDSDTAEPLIAPTAYSKSGLDIPKTPGLNLSDRTEPPKPGRYWLGVPPDYMEVEGVPPAEDLFQRVRLDWLILFDLRMWKKVRNDLRSLYISTVVTIPEFKRVLGLRFAGLYTTLAQLYLIGDREPDHSIINISLQMLTTPSITTEIVERGNFLTSLMAILYTFLTTRQVGHPWDVSSSAVLAFDSGSVTNRRMYHFFVDLKYLFSSPHVQKCLRTEDRYMMQFLDLVKLHQGICPNTRAIGEHVEYETGTWISASLITREINRLCRQFSDAYRNLQGADLSHLARAIRYTAKTVILNSIGSERQRFSQAEVREEVQFRVLSDFEFDSPAAFYDVVRFVVEEQPISFHHALHYTLSWLIECGKSQSLDNLRHYLGFSTQELKSQPRSMGRKVMPRRLNLTPEDYLMAAFDYPLRVCAWLAQMKAGMWVRNGISLRHQAGTYRGVSQRDVAHHRDIFLLQTALVVCNPSRVLVSIIDRFGMERWVKGIFEQKAEAQDDSQHLDVVEDMIHLLIVLVSDRTSLVDAEDDAATQLMALRRDIIHVLCFKPLSYTDICNKLPDRFQEQENFQEVLEEMATFKSPDGNTDVGTFELDPQYIEEVDPYSAHYNKNQREESETAYRKWMAKKTGQPAESIVYEPKLQAITTGAFVGLSEFTSTGVFAQLIYYSLLYPLVAQKLTPTVPFTRIETFLQVVLHLVLIAIAEDKTYGAGAEGLQGGGDDSATSFIHYALNQQARSNFMPESPEAKTIVSLLDMMSTKDEFKACHPKIALILKRMRQKRPTDFESAYARLGVSVDRISTASPAYNSSNANEERERKKRAAMDRQARVMAQFQEQQKSFLANQGDIDWGIDDDEDEDMEASGTGAGAGYEEEKKLWKYPSGTCILCQEDTDDRRLHGTFAFFTESLILRQTDLQDPDFVREAASTPKNLDRSAESIRPFGVAHENRQKVVKIGTDGEPFESERQVIGKGFPSKNCQPGVLSVGCGHIMHHHCFEAYFEATLRRHNQQIARHHPEDTEKLEFVCPLCKALGNAFLPIVWKGKEESYPGALAPTTAFSSFLDEQMAGEAYYVLSAPRPPDEVQAMQRLYIGSSMLTSVSDKASQLVYEAWERLPQSPHYLQGPTSAGPAGALGAAGWPPIPAAMAGAAAAAAAAAGVGGGGAAGGAAGGGGGAGVAGAGPGTVSGSGAFASGSGSGARVQPELANVVRDLVSAYRRLKRTLRTNDLPMLQMMDNGRGRNELYGSDTLAQAVGYSISAVEIQQRGTDAEYGMTLLSKIPEQSLTHLRILCETVTSYIAIGAQRHGGDNRVDREFRRDAERQHCQLFVTMYFGQETEATARPTEQYGPLLGLDPFIFLCESVFGMVPALKMEVAHVLQLCYLAELVKVVYHMGRNIPVSAWINELMNRQSGGDPALENFALFCLSIAHMDLGARTNRRQSVVIDASLLATDALGANRGFDQEGVNTLEGYYNFVKKYALVFLRKSVVLMYAHAGVDFNSHVSPAPELSELERLSEVLKLPSFDEMCSSLVNDQSSSFSSSSSSASWPASTPQLVNGWVHHYYTHTWGKHKAAGTKGLPSNAGDAATEDDASSTISGELAMSNASGAASNSGASNKATVGSTSSSSSTTQSKDQPPSQPSSALLSHPGIYELVGLPQNFEQLLDECTRARCPTTGKDVSDPMICLLCGEVFCGQAICCLKEERIGRTHARRRIGGAQQHMRRCQRNMGLFLNIRKCCIYYLHRMSGSYGYAPYIDKYGEVDLGFRHGRPLQLNQRRYDAMLRAVWLSHGVPSFISRKLEMDINNGGWETI
ncbi:E3 ubiquitin-protein ligase ubr1 [Sporothrix stenoceras]|uniref:E3 ubiquitin-protein ligase n=1 Tax=Sporothrix stenoceras TaxID=5173 RepID=A0ABR3Z960_9PEZI